MDYFNEAFGGFDPQNDSDAAVKFALNMIFMDERFGELSHLLNDGDPLGGIEGEPGWIIERRDGGASGQMPGYADWPANSSFRAYVDPTCYKLAYPEVFLEGRLFCTYVSKIVEAYISSNSLNDNSIQNVKKAVAVW